MLREGWRVAEIALVLKVGQKFVRKVRRILELIKPVHEYRPTQGKLKRLSSEWSFNVLLLVLAYCLN